jgi:hypothetical protein
LKGITVTQLHSDLYQRIQNENLSLDEWLRSNPLPAQDGMSAYDRLSDLLREANDAFFGIVSKLNEQGEWVRDATKAIPLEQRMSHNEPGIEANNAMLRCLSRLRPIDYAISQKHGQEGEALRQELKTSLVALVGSLSRLAQQENLVPQQKRQIIRQIEEGFNTSLIRILHKANLTQGCETLADAEKLLFHYRNLSSVLIPARPMITLTYDDDNHVFQRETQYPVTVKTERQQEALQALRSITPYPSTEDRNSHNVTNLATQEADSLFASLIASDDRALPAQTRKSHLVGVKNAFVVKNELFFNVSAEEINAEQQASKDNTLWLARTGSPVYVGCGESPATIQLQTQQSLEQIRRTASNLLLVPTDLSDEEDDYHITRQQPLRLHVTCLNTDTPLQNQNIIVNNIKIATRLLGDGISYLPTNADGLTRKAKVDHEMFSEEEQKPDGRAVFFKADRIHDVATVMLTTAKLPNTLSVVNCASGQDRTGTAIEKATQIWMQERYAESIKNLGSIDTMRAMGGNAAEITTHHVHGSPGMKDDSRADNTFGSGTTFSPLASSQFYLTSAGTNKKNTVGNVAFLKQANKFGLQEYRANWDAFNKACQSMPFSEDNEQLKQFHLTAAALQNEIRTLVGQNPERLDAKGLTDLNLVLKYATLAIKNPKDQANLGQLDALSRHVSGKESPGWKALGAILMAFAAVAFVIAVPLAHTVVGTGVAIGIGLVGGGLGYIGLSMFHGSRQKGLAKSVSDFKTALESESEEEPDQVSPQSCNSTLS